MYPYSLNSLVHFSALFFVHSGCCPSIRQMSVGSLMTATSKPRTKTGKHFDPVIVEHIGTNGQINVHVVNLRAKKKRFAKPVSVYFRICVIALTNANKTRLDVIAAWPSAAELSMGWVDPWVALGWVGSTIAKVLKT